MTGSAFMDQIGGEWAGTPGGLGSVWLVIALSFCLGQIIGWLYIWTHQGVSYSRSFTVAMAALPMIVALVMMIMVDNIVVAFGLFAVFAIVRFRNIVKDTRDTAFILWAIMSGMAVGTMRFSLAVIAALAVSALFAYLYAVKFGARSRFDATLSLHLADADAALPALAPVLGRHTLTNELVSQRGEETGDMSLSYHLEMRDPARSAELVAELRRITGVEEASFFRREEEAEL